MGLLGGKKSRQIVGLDIGSSSIKAVELKATKAGYELVSFGMESLAPDTVVDGAIMYAPPVANAVSTIFDSFFVNSLAYGFAHLRVIHYSIIHLVLVSQPFYSTIALLIAS